MRTFRPHLETLSSRLLPAVRWTLAGTVLDVAALGNGPHDVLVRPSPAGLDIVADGKTASFANLTQVNYQGGKGDDSFVNRTPLGGVIDVGEGDNVVNSQARSTISAGDGNNFIQDLAGNSTLVVGNGLNNIYGGAGDTIVAGSGRNIIYAILPGNTSITVAPHQGTDYLFVGPDTILVGAQPQDRVARFFAPGRTIGSGSLVLDGRTLYYAASNAGDTYVATPLNAQSFQVTTITNGILAQAVFDYASVDLIANFGGAGNDRFFNNTAIADVQYGAGGQNVLVGGFGELNLLKAGGAAGNSVAIGRSPVYNDLTGSGTPGVTTILVVNNPAAFNVFRTNSVTDVLVGMKRRDQVVTLFPDQVWFS